ncbi:MAG: hypothetical protein GY699_15210 [Desulfobacteraceae bacterium]|nr:hypothetical protein [Desulfobacteraceae bacterium]
MKKILYILLPLICVVSIFGFLFGYQTVLVVSTLYNLRDVPIVDQVPLDLNLKLSNCKDVKNSISFYGYSFDVPWTNIEERRTEKDFSSIKFEDGIAILVPDPKLNIGIKNNLLSQTKNYDVKPLDLFGKEVLDSEYSLIKAMLSTAKKDFSIFDSRKNTIKKMVLLTMKTVYLPLESETGIYSFNGEGYNGFQLGDSSLKHRKITINYFDYEGKEFVVMLYVQKDKKAELKQDYINCIIRSIKKNN